MYEGHLFPNLLGEVKKSPEVPFHLVQICNFQGVNNILSLELYIVFYLPFKINSYYQLQFNPCLTPAGYHFNDEQLPSGL